MFGKKNNNGKLRIPPISKEEVLRGLQQAAAYFERNIQTCILFKPEYEVSIAINSILEEKETLTEMKVLEVLRLLNEIDGTEHFDGSGWFDYQIRVGSFLRVSGFEIEEKDRKFYLKN